MEILLPARLPAIHHNHPARYTSKTDTCPVGEGRELVGRRKDKREFPVEIHLSTLEAAAIP